MRVCIDIDGVLADVRKHVEEHLLPDGDWETYFSHTLEFPQIGPMTALFLALAESPYYETYLVTGRPESNRKLTAKWFLSIMPGISREMLRSHLLMRSDGDPRPTHEVKMQWFRELSPSLVIDDDPEVAKAATEAGFVVLQVHGFRVTNADLVPKVKEVST